MKTQKQIDDFVDSADVHLKRATTSIEEGWQYATVFQSCSIEQLQDISFVLGSNTEVLN